MSITRTVFPFPGRTPSWFAGHMARSLRELPALLDEVDLVLEARDARLPLTSVNHAFDSMLERVWGHAGSGPDRRGKGKEKIVVYTKRDLAEARYEKPLTSAFWKQAKQRVMFADSRVDQDVRGILRLAARAANEYGEAVTDLKVLVVGMPNVGKSSLLNALRRVGVRRGKVFTTGAMPGVTRRLTGTVRVYDKPPIYVFDTPGVMMPFLGHGERGAERGLKLALSAGIKEGLFEPDSIADYLLFKMNLRLAAEESLLAPNDPTRHESYITKLPFPSDFQPTEDINVFLDALARRLGALRKGGETDIDAAITFLLRQFREGKIGRWTLDDLDGREAEYVASRSGISRSVESLSPQDDEPEVIPSNDLGYVISDMGAVGASPDNASSDPETGEAPTPSTPTSTTPPPSESTRSNKTPDPTLEERVSATVQKFLVQAAQERADADAGRNRSSTQQKKADRKAKSEYREAKMRAKLQDKRPGALASGASARGGISARSRRR